MEDPDFQNTVDKVRYRVAKISEDLEQLPIEEHRTIIAKASINCCESCIAQLSLRFLTKPNYTPINDAPKVPLSLNPIKYIIALKA
jgi:hypothetical protein